MVMTNDDYPSNMSKHVRDPKVYEKDGTYYMIQGGRDEKDRGCALLFQSADLKTGSGMILFIRKKHSVICGNVQTCLKSMDSRS